MVQVLNYSERSWVGERRELVGFKQLDVRFSSTFFKNYTYTLARSLSDPLLNFLRERLAAVPVVHGTKTQL
jgi:hypothetical protein